jgi:hypothetical protein
MDSTTSSTTTTTTMLTFMQPGAQENGDLINSRREGYIKKTDNDGAAAARRHQPLTKKSIC